MTDEPELLIEDVGAVRTVTLNRPTRKNAITTDMWMALGETLRDVTDGHRIRALVLTGAGGAFCAGADISGTEGKTEFSDPGEQMRAINDVVLRLNNLPVPTIAKVGGVAAGAGWNLALGCDLVAATPVARFCQIFSKRALSLDCGGSWLLPKLVGLQQAKRLALLADMISAEEAEALGLVTWIQPEEDIDAFVADLAARLAAGPPIALAQTKALLNGSADHTLSEALESETRAQAANLAGGDIVEAFAAFSEKRDPVYSGAVGSSR